MSFDYDKIRQDQESGSHWATYSDLFMVLSLVFLLLYVTSSLRTGTFGVQKKIEHLKLVRENSDLKQQNKVYRTLKDNYLQTGASQDEQAVYSELMDKLKLLKEEAKSEKETLQAASEENAKKEVALNKYQQMIRNIINTNMLSAARIKRKDRVIIAKEGDIKEKKSEIKGLKRTVASKEKDISRGERKIGSLNSALEKKVAKLEKEYKRRKISKKKMKQKIAKLRKVNKGRVQKLKSSNEKISEELQQVNTNLDQATVQLTTAQKTINQQGSTIEALKDDKNQFESKVKSLQSNFKRNMAKEKSQFMSKLKSQKLSSRARSAKQAEFKRQSKAKEKKLAREVASMQSQIQSTQDALNTALSEKSKFASDVKGLKRDKSQLSKDLKKAQAIANAKKRLVQRIQRNLRKSGLKASVDGKTGDVIINFGNEYFDTGKAKLKGAMKKTLEKFMPLYSKSLFSDQKTAEKIASVEIIGFASPTYKGKFVDPVSLKAENREAVNYNLDLSYYRARSIFDHIFDTRKMKYKFQKVLLPKVKVTGRSYLADGSERDIASGMSQREYCKKYDCKKAQRVIIRFNLEN